VSSRKPGRRKDLDWPNAILRKLEKAAEIANERRLVPVFLGDMFNEAVEPDESVKTRLIRILKRFWMPPICNTGNHDIAYSTLSDEDSLAGLAESDVVDVVKLSGPVVRLKLGVKVVGLGMTPYGQDIPRDVRGAMSGCDVVVWATHHDIAFAGTYPGAAQPFAIEGCQLVVNGHVHASRKEVVVGRTMWLNPGNINRQSVDLIDHVPCVWALAVGGRMEPIPLPYEKEIFDLTGRLVDAVAPDADAAEQDAESAFVSMLKAEDSAEMKKSDDGSILREDIEAKFEADGTDESVKSVVLSLLDEACRRPAKTG
jgi:hypothetical protein